MSMPPPEMVEKFKRDIEGHVAMWSPPGVVNIWTPKTQFLHPFVIDHVSFQTWLDDLYPEFKDMPVVKKPFKDNDPGMNYIGGRWVFYRSEMPTFKRNFRLVGKRVVGGEQWIMNALEYMNPYDTKQRGAVLFTDTVYIPTLADYKSDFQPWMSVTPNEVISQSPGFEWAYGHVLVGGLGMGWATYIMRNLPKVTKVTVVERDPHIIKFFGEKISAKPGVPMEIVQSDLYKYTDKHADKFDSMVLDIWPRQSDSNYDPDLRKLRKRFKGRIWAWGETRRSRR